MTNWTQQELEELMAKMTKKAMTDAEFRKEVLADANKALEKLAGKPLPEGSSLKCIERDPNYSSTFVLPDLIDEERLDDEALTSVAGGISVAAIVSFCAIAGGVGPDAVMCGAKGCAADACVGFLAGRPDDHKCVGQACAGKQDMKDSTHHENSPCTGHACYSYGSIHL